MFVVLVLSTVLYNITKSPTEIRITFIMFWILVIAFVENGCRERVSKLYSQVYGNKLSTLHLLIYSKFTVQVITYVYY